MTSGYGSHYPVLGAAVARTAGPVLELGTGDFSTILLHYATAPHRLLASADMNAEWMSKYRAYESNRHTFHLVEPKGDDALPKVTREIQGWREWTWADQTYWGCIFIDNAPGEARHELAIRFANAADLIICHDSETDYAAGGNYMYDKAKPHFKYVSEFKRFRPYTLILSNTMRFEIEECDKVWIVT